MTQVMVTGDTQSDSMRPFTALVAQMELAWNKGDPQGFAGCFGEQADFIDMMGGHGTGRKMVEASHRAMFSGPFAQSKIEYRIEKVKPIGQRTAVVFLRAKLKLKDGEIWSRPTLTVRLANDGWKIAVFQTTRVVDSLTGAKAAAPAAAEKKPAAKAEKAEAKEEAPKSGKAAAPKKK